MFYGSKLNCDISKWNVSNVTDMQHMFLYSQFSWDISKWDISNVVNGKTYIKSLIDISLLFKDNDTPQGFENPVKSIAKLKYIVLKRQFDSKKESELLIKIRTLQAFEKVKPAILDKEVVRLYKKYTVPAKMAKIQRKTKKAENKAKKAATKEALRAASRKASGKSYSKFFKGSESNSSSSNNSPVKSTSSWSPNYERSRSSSNNDEVIIDRTGIHTKKQRRSHNSYNSD
jgi:surface protein